MKHTLTEREQGIVEPLRKKWLDGLEAGQLMQEILSLIADARGMDPATTRLTEDGSTLYMEESDAKT